MKRYIHSNTDFEHRSFSFKSPSGNRYSFSGDVDTATGFMSGTIQKITPYDDAEYYWARINSNGVATVFYKGKKVDQIHLWSYERDEEDINDYFYDIAVGVSDELDNFNKDIKPVMVHY